MNSEEKFKNHLKKLLEEKEFDFDEVNWLKASQMIDSKKSKKRVWPFFLVFGIFIGSAVTYLLFESNTPEVAHLSLGHRINTSPLAAESGVDDKSIIPVEKAEPIKEDFYSLKSVSNYKVNKKLPKQSAYSSGQKTKNLLISKTALSKPSNHTSDSNDESFTSSDPTPAIDSHVAIAFGAENISDINTTINPTVDGDSISFKNQSTPISNSVNVNSDKIEKTVLADKEKVIPISSLTETSAVSPIGGIADEPLSESSPSYVLSIEAGTSFLFGWNYNGEKEARGFNPVLGLNYHNKISDKLDFSMGLQFNTIGHLSYFSDTSKVTRYKTGEESEVTVITPQTLYYLALPIKLSHNINNKNTIGAGAYFCYLITSNSTVENYHQSDQAGQSITTKETGYTEGFANYNFELSAFYKRRLYKNLSLNAEFVFGLTDLKNNAFFNNTVRETSTGFKLTLLYGLIRR